MRSILLVFALSVLALGLRAQQDPQFTHNMFNHAFVNPGSYGLSDGITVTGIFREQWVGFKDKDPTQNLLTLKDIPLKRSKIINFCWKYWIPIFTLSFSFDNFWNLKKLNQLYPEKQNKNLISISNCFEVVPRIRCYYYKLIPFLGSISL